MTVLWSEQVGTLTMRLVEKDADKPRFYLTISGEYGTVGFAPLGADRDHAYTAYHARKAMHIRRSKELKL